MTIFIALSALTAGLLLDTFYPYQDAAFSKHIKTFEQLSNKKVDTGIRFGKLPKGTLGACYTLSGNVRIAKKTWHQLKPLVQEALIFHELGHCLLGREHQTNFTIRFSDGCPDSLMYPYLIRSCYIKHRNYYIKELFDKST